MNTKHAQIHSLTIKKKVLTSLHFPLGLLLSFPPLHNYKTPLICPNFIGTTVYLQFLPQFYPPDFHPHPLIVKNDLHIAKLKRLFSF